MEDKIYRFKTSNAREVRQTLSTMVNLLANKKMDVKTSNAIIYACNSILQSIRTDEIEQKVNKIEGILNKRGEK